MSALTQRFWDRVDRSGGPDACWIWTGASRHGYGKLRRGGKDRYVHRVVAEAAGLDTSGVIHHACGEKRCVNPRHLEPLSSQSEHARGHDVLGTLKRLKTHCPHGHPYAGDNLYVDPLGRRHCRACWSVWGRRSYAKRKAAAA